MYKKNIIGHHGEAGIKNPCVRKFSCVSSCQKLDFNESSQLINKFSDVFSLLHDNNHKILYNFLNTSWIYYSEVELITKKFILFKYIFIQAQIF